LLHATRTIVLPGSRGRGDIQTSLMGSATAELHARNVRTTADATATESWVSWHHRFMRPRLNRPKGADPAHCARFDSKSIRNLAHAFSAPRIGRGRSRLGETPLVMSIWSASIGNNVRRADSSSLPRPYCHFELQHGPSPNIAHRLFASPESRLARVGMWAISSAVAESRTVAQPQLSFCYFACPTL
jgi:hypothetical protein